MYKYNFLRQMNVFGWEEIEPVILAGLVLNAPILLLGHTGDGKTYAVKQIANALGIKEFQNYDASKALFEDIIGFPRFITKKDEQIVKYAKTPLTIWDKEFVFIDEISRALPETQNKWLEIINNKQLMGVKLDNLKYIFLAMNPVNDYIGVYNLDYALVERFFAVIKVPSLFEMQKEDIGKISINNENINMKKNKKFIDYIVNIRKKYIKLKNKKSFLKIGEMCSKILKEMKVNELELSKNGRRLNILTRMVAVLLLIEDFKVTNINIEIIIKRYLKYLLPFYINIEDYDRIENLIEDILQNNIEKTEYYRLIKYLSSVDTLSYAEIEFNKMKRDWLENDNKTISVEQIKWRRLKILAILYFIMTNNYFNNAISFLNMDKLWMDICKEFFHPKHNSLKESIKESLGKNKYKQFLKYLKEAENVYKTICIQKNRG